MEALSVTSYCHVLSVKWLPIKKVNKKKRCTDGSAGDGLAWLSSWPVMTSDQLTSVRLLWFCVGHIDTHDSPLQQVGLGKTWKSESSSTSVFIVSSANHKRGNITNIKNSCGSNSWEFSHQKEHLWSELQTVRFRYTDKHVDLRSGCDRTAAA